jgi:hypothetical protein
VGDKFVQSQGFAVELHSEVVGIAVRVSGGFVFFSSDRRFERLDGTLFPRTRAMLQRLQDFEQPDGARRNGKEDE